MPARRRFGSVRRLPSGRWQARCWDTARNRIVAPNTVATKGDGQRWLSAAETDMARGVWHDPRAADVELRAWADRWLVAKTPQLQASTVDLYRYLLRRHIVPHFGVMAVGRMTAIDVQAWLAAYGGLRWGELAALRRSDINLVSGPEVTSEPQAPDQDFCGGDDGTRTHDPLLAKQVL